MERQKALADRLLDFAALVRREQHRYDEVRQLSREFLAAGKSDATTRTMEAWKRCHAIRQGFADDLRGAGTEAPQSIRASLYKLAKRLETSADDISDELCEVAAELLETRPQEPYPDIDNQERNQWLYDERQSGSTSQTIISKLEKLSPKNSWSPITSNQAISDAVKKHANWLGVDTPKGKSGRPAKS